MTNQLQQSTKDRRESGRVKRMPDKSQEAKSQSNENDRQRSKFESYEKQLQGMREAMDAMVLHHDTSVHLV